MVQKGDQQLRAQAIPILTTPRISPNHPFSNPTRSLWASSPKKAVIYPSEPAPVSLDCILSSPGAWTVGSLICPFPPATILASRTMHKENKHTQMDLTRCHTFLGVPVFDLSLARSVPRHRPEYGILSLDGDQDDRTFVRLGSWVGESPESHLQEY